MLALLQGVLHQTVALLYHRCLPARHPAVPLAGWQLGLANLNSPALLSMVWQLVGWAVWPLDCCTDGCTYGLEWALVAASSRHQEDHQEAPGSVLWDRCGFAGLGHAYDGLWARLSPQQPAVSWAVWLLGCRPWAVHPVPASADRWQSHPAASPTASGHPTQSGLFTARAVKLLAGVHAVVDLKHYSEEEHLSIVIYCHAGSGKITNTGRLIFEWGGPPGREWNKHGQGGCASIPRRPGQTLQLADGADAGEPEQPFPLW